MSCTTTDAITNSAQAMVAFVREFAKRDPIYAKGHEKIRIADARRLIADHDELAALPASAIPSPLTATMVRGLPGGGMDDSTFAAVETALDAAWAPSTSEERWLTLPERVAALGAGRSKMLAMLRECAEGHALHNDLLDLIAQMEA
jgi:hypothetical protein